MAKYRLRYSFDPDAGICLWAANDAARERFGYPVDARDLPLPGNTRRQVWYVCAWFDTSINWDDPALPSPWGREERERFNAEAQKLVFAPVPEGDAVAQLARFRDAVLPRRNLHLFLLTSSRRRHPG